ncbi:MAG TPA: hypothetical protein VK867_06320, partial [Candidatus Limnocylindrales bacterium]|nr:hypothetical protein [Candidatus Limnocylindrales bacterium]
MTAITRQNGSGSGSALPMTLAALRFLRLAIGQAEARTDAISITGTPEANAVPTDTRRLQLMADAVTRAVVTVPDGRVIVGLDVVIRDDGGITTYTIMPPGIGVGEHTIVS